MEHKPYQSIEIDDKVYWDYNFKIGKVIYEISVDQQTGKLFINKDESRGD